jgi:hypothetical protein
MTDYTVPCDVFARLSRVIAFENDDMNEWFRSIRIDNGLAVASNRTIMAVENIHVPNGNPDGIVHIVADPLLIEQCRKEAPFKSFLTITVNEVLRFAVAKTTLGYIHPGNCAVWSDKPNDFDRWRSLVELTRQAPVASKGAMFWNAENIANLAAAAPSGRIVFEEFIDATGSRPTLVRDVNDYEWFGIFQPFGYQTAYSSATLPSWMTAR